jgi:multicomponent Na+:H+ antiporter subunit F
MNGLIDTIPGWGLDGAFILLSLSLVGCLWRLIAGPTPYDRIVASDLTAAIVMCFAVVLSLETGLRYMLDLGLAIAVIAFLSAVAFSRHLERSALEKCRAQDLSEEEVS